MTTKRQQSETKSAPAFIAYHVANRDDQEKGFWTRVGVAFPNKDGKGYNLLLETFPLDGRITLRVPSEKTEESK